MYMYLICFDQPTKLQSMYLNILSALVIIYDQNFMLAYVHSSAHYRAQSWRVCNLPLWHNFGGGIGIVMVLAALLEPG